MIITGYQGIGKSTLASKRMDVIDLESSCFWNKEVTPKSRPNDWYVYYGQVAIDLSKQGYTVFVSCHPQVREWIENNRGKERFCAIFPSKSIEKEWINKLQNRYDDTKSEKDLAALEHAKKFFKSDIDKLMYECSYGIEMYSDAIILDKIDYDLGDIVDKFVDYFKENTLENEETMER